MPSSAVGIRGTHPAVASPRLLSAQPVTEHSPPAVLACSATGRSGESQGPVLADALPLRAEAFLEYALFCRCRISPGEILKTIAMNNPADFSPHGQEPCYHLV